MIESLSAEEITSILVRNHVARIAFAVHDRVDIEPIHYVYAQGWIYGRTSPGAKLATVQRNRCVAVEVDEVESLFDWRSVVVHGGLYVLHAEDDREMWDHAVTLLRTLVPETLTARDPAPHRDVVFRIARQEATGRVSRSESA
jgi:nitroimidazol reductase NimA-like FMN-containing flavoprotein (pyridoxamine 5'-phosphate oxidase superfamily)